MDFAENALFSSFGVIADAKLLDFSPSNIFILVMCKQYIIYSIYVSLGACARVVVVLMCVSLGTRLSVTMLVATYLIKFYYVEFEVLLMTS